MDVEPGAGDERLAATGRPSVEPDERVALEADALAEQPVGQGVAGFPAGGRGSVEQLEGAR